MPADTNGAKDGIDDNNNNKRVLFSTSSASQSPQPPPASSASATSIISIHSGKGRLRGGGVRPIGTTKSIRQLAQKLEQRMGPVLMLSLLTIGTVLFLYGLYHESIRNALQDFVDTMQQVVLQNQQRELAELTNIGTTTTTTTVVATAVKNVDNSTLAVVEISGETGSNNNNENVNVPTTTTAAEMPPNAVVHSILRHRADQLEELDGFKEKFHATTVTLWCLVALNVFGLLALAFGVFVLYKKGKSPVGMRRSGKMAKLCRTLYIALLLLTCLLMSVQLFLLLFSLLPNSVAFPTIVDRLFDAYLLEEVPPESRAEILAPIEEEFACKLEVEHELLEKMGLQQKCVPKIKDRLLPSYIVVFLVAIAICPFLFAIFTILWATTIKNCGAVETARKRIEVSQSDRRQQRHDEILQSRASEFTGKIQQPVYY